MSRKVFIFLVFIEAIVSPIFSQVPITVETNTMRHGDILCKVEVGYVSEGERGEDAVWCLPEIGDDGREWLQAINSNVDTVAVYEKGRILHYFAHGDTLTFKGLQSPRAYKIYSEERPYMRYPFQYGDSICGDYRGDCREENEYFAVSGFGSTVADGMGCLTDGEDTLRHVTRLHLVDDYVYNFKSGESYRLKEDRYMWYCAGYRYAIMESVRTAMYDNGAFVPVDSVTYLFLPYMQMELAEDEENDALLAELEAMDAALRALNNGLGVGNLASVNAGLSADGRTMTIDYELSGDTGISFYACDIMGNLLGSVQYQNREAGEWQDCIVLNLRPIGNAVMLRIDCGEQRVSMKVTMDIY